MFWGIIALAIAVIVLLLFILWVNRRPKVPASQLPTLARESPPTARLKLPEPEELFPLNPGEIRGRRKLSAEDIAGIPGELDTRGVSPELLARMEAAGMNTTHERWEDSPAAKRRNPRGPIHATEGLRGERRRRDDDDSLLTGAAIIGAISASSDARPAQAAPSAPDHGGFGGEGFSTGGSFGGESFSSGGGDSGGGGGSSD